MVARQRKTGESFKNFQSNLKSIQIPTELHSRSQSHLSLLASGTLARRKGGKVLTRLMRNVIECGHDD